jgi:hypothetical protein
VEPLFWAPMITTWGKHRSGATSEPTTRQQHCDGRLDCSDTLHAHRDTLYTLSAGHSCAMRVGGTRSMNDGPHASPSTGTRPPAAQPSTSASASASTGTAGATHTPLSRCEHNTVKQARAQAHLKHNSHGIAGRVATVEKPLGPKLQHVTHRTVPTFGCRRFWSVNRQHNSTLLQYTAS